MKTTKKKEKRLKNNSGITLIALVVTIVVLLILAGVSINLVVGQNGVINKSKFAKDANRRESIQEQLELWKGNKSIEDAVDGSSTSSIQDFVLDLKNKGTINQEEYNQIETTHKLVIGEQEPILFPYSKTLVQAFKDGEIKVGDYVTNYNEKLKNKTASQNITTEESGIDVEQTYNVNTATTWRVLGLDESGTHLKLTTGSPIRRSGQDPYLHLKGAEGWYRTNDNFVGKDGNVLNKICKIYDSNLSQETRSMTPDDINLALGVEVDKTPNASKLYRKNDASKTAIPAFQGLYGKSYTLTGADYSPYNYLNDKNKDLYPETANFKRNQEGNVVNGDGYVYQFDGVLTRTGNEVLYDMLFNEAGGTGATSMNKAYWLASSGVGAYSYGAYFGTGAVVEGAVYSGSGLFSSVGAVGECFLGVRPVVSLKSEVSLDDLTFSSTGSEPAWEGSNGDGFVSSNLSGETGKVTPKATP